MQYTDELVFSPDALAARSKLYSGLNEVNIFFEDANKEYIYETIFDKLLGSEYKIVALFPCGGKSEVIKQFSEQGKSTAGVTNIFLMDGDFDRIIHANEMLKDSNVIYLQSYNIENYFIDKHAVCQFAKGLTKRIDRENESIIGFDIWRKQIVSEAKPLFLCYCYIQQEYPSDKNVSRSPYEFLDCKTGYKKQDNSYIEFYESYASKDPDMTKKIEGIDSKYQSIYGKDYFHLICGKFLLDSLYCHIKNVTSNNFKKEIMKWSLINGFDVGTLNYVKEAIQKAIDLQKQQTQLSSTTSL